MIERKCIFMSKNDDVPDRANVLLNSTVDIGICLSEVDDIVIKSGQKHTRPMLDRLWLRTTTVSKTDLKDRYRPRGVRMN